ncbi:MAG: NAD(P)-dependent oxidoreductase [Alphaproteobacteria bacterium]|jgi:3-hydroxyisobutyrate dehydrogenase|nr:NAD(P)-dependent oxidoreductase [Alphaproteobacteria bacterium]MDP6815283.1 NAD(P)-dependent oxidoreductase [Alphaproteobacteria bacterium]
MAQVGFIGLGIMGGRFAANLQQAGYDLVVHDLHRQVAEPYLAAGAAWAETPKAVAEAADVVLTSLPGPAEVEAVALDGETGLIAGLAKDGVLFDLSTNSPTLVRRIHAAFAEQGLHMLDAPVSGGPKGAASGKLAIWVGGERAVFERHRAVLDALGDQVRYIGDIGAGSIAKLVHNSAGYAIQCALAEVFSVGVKAGVEPLALWQAVRQGARGRQRTFDSLADHFLVNQYDPPDFALALAHKDVALAGQLGRDMGVPMRMVDLTEAELSEALNRGWAERDSRVAMLLQTERAGVDIEVPADRVEAAFDAEN